MPDSDVSLSSGAHKWHEISDLPQDLEFLRDRELESLFLVWTKQKQQIEQPEGLRSFREQLAREWAIETGIIEGIYTLDRGITRTLIERGIESSYISHDGTNKDPELVARIIQAHADALEGLFAFVKSERELSTSYIKELHSALLRHQDTIVVFDEAGHPFEAKLEKGAYKRLPNNPLRADGTIHEYCPPEHVASEMDRLIEMHRLHVQRGLRPHIDAAWLHHAFTEIHPFQDGNGRVARALASMVFIKEGYFPLVVHRDDRERYITALEAADRGDLADLVEAFSQIQKRALTKAIARGADVREIRSVDDAISATVETLVGLERLVPDAHLKARQTAEALHIDTQKRLNDIAAKLSHELSRLNPPPKFSVGLRVGTLAKELGLLGQKLQYDPNPNDHQTSLLVLSTDPTPSSVLVSFHGIGKAFRGLIAVVAYFQRGQGDPIPLADDVFRVSYQDELPEIEQRYLEWLEIALMRGLAEWRHGLV